MNDFHIVALPEAVAADARRRALPRQTVTEAHSSPCRVCLEDAAVGEDVLLFGYSPFSHDVPYRTVGPIFVHAEACTPFVAGAAATDALERRLLSLRAHAEDGTMLHCDVTEGTGLGALAARFFEDARVAEIHVHHARAGCFACRLQRPTR
jgi:hypothetical protein